MTKAFLSWPDFKHLRYAAMLMLLVGGLFSAVFIGADHFTSLRKNHLQLYFQKELAIPFLPLMILFYNSIYLLFLMTPFVIRNAKDFRKLALSTSVIIVVSGLMFITIPAKLGFPSHHVDGWIGNIFHFSDRINLEYNLVPSLHVGLSILLIQVFYLEAASRIRVFLLTWGIVITISTLLTHQHHVLDVIAGLILARIAFNEIYAKRITG